MLRRERRLLARRQTFGDERGALLPNVSFRIGDAAFELWLPFGRKVDAQRLPVVPDHTHAALRPKDRDGMAVLLAALMAMRIEEIDSALDVRESAMAVIEQHHRVVLFSHGNLALANDLARGRNNACHGDNRSSGTQ